jgi:hypothetical protein
MNTFEYRVYPTRVQRHQVLACLNASRALYNQMLQASQVQDDTNGTLPTTYDRTVRFKGRGGEVVPVTTVQTLADRLSQALPRYLQRNDLGLPGGFPRCKAANCWHSIQLRQYAESRDVWLDRERLERGVVWQGSAPLG